MNNTTYGGERLYTVQDVLNPNLQPHQMNTYKAPDGREVIMHATAKEVKTEKGVFTRIDNAPQIVVPAGISDSRKEENKEEKKEEKK